jgi:hypothetical protein
MTPPLNLAKASDSVAHDEWTPLMARRITQALYTAPEVERIQTWRDGERLLARFHALAARFASGDLDYATVVQR